MTIPIQNDLSPALIDLTVPQGSTVQFFYQLFTDEAYTLPMDLTGYSALSQIRKYPGSTIIEGTIPITLGVKFENGVIVPAALTLGGISLDFSDTVTSSIPIREEEYVYDVWLIDSSGIKRMIMTGSLNLVDQVTQFA